MATTKRALWIATTSALLLTCAWKLSHTHPKPVAAQTSTAAQVSTGKAILLDQGWSPEIRERYYHISQGTTVMPYDIFLNLEVAGSEELFRSDANSERYGLTPDAPDPKWNPDGLPIGLGKTVTPDGPRQSQQRR